MASNSRMRVWGYATCDGTMALTSDPDLAREWRQMFRDRGEYGPFEFTLTPSAKDYLRAKREIGEARAAKREAMGDG